MGIRDNLRTLFLRFFARRIVTPFAPYMLCDAYLASEIAKYGLRGLNPPAINLAESSDWPRGECPVVYVQVNQLDVFSTQILSKIPGPFILITGKWHLPGLELNEGVSMLLANPHLKRWFSQNQVFENVPILPFPYGVKLSSAPHVYWRMRLQKFLGVGRSGVFVPHVASHAHLEGPALQARGELAAIMGPRLKLRPYLDNILRHKYVVSPPGDRMDTYRHWEAVALGAIPVSNLPPPLSLMFGAGMFQQDSFSAVRTVAFTAPGCAPRPELATVAYWRQRLKRTD